MLDIPELLRNDYTNFLEQHRIPSYSTNYYLKWLRFYLDFCNKYHYAHDDRASLPLFLKKLQEKKPTPRRQKQATHAINLYYALQKNDFALNQVKNDTSTNDAVARQSSTGSMPEKPTWEKVYIERT